MTKSHEHHIVHIVGSLDGGGIQNLVLGLASAAPLNRFKHSVICLLGVRGDLVDAYRRKNISLYSCRIKWPRRVRILPGGLLEWIRTQAERTFTQRLAWLLRTIKADVVHTHLPRGIDLVVQAASQKCGLPVVWTIHAENVKYESSEYSRLQKATQMLVQSEYGRITADSKMLTDRFLAHFPNASRITKVIHAGADTKKFEPNIPKDADWKRKLGISDQAIVFGSCGRLAHVKGFDIFIEAAASLLERGVDAHFAISGKGDKHEELSVQIARLGLTDRFHLLGFQPDLAFTIKQFDVFILSSRSEGFPLSLIEALSAGLPCIATDISGVREMLGENGGIVVPPETSSAITKAMDAMLNPLTRQKFSNEAVKRGQRFTFDHCASEFADIYSSLLP